MKALFFYLYMLLAVEKISGQGIGIGTTTPDSSAILDIYSNNKGVLLPRVHLTSLFDTTTIPNPATALLVYNTNSSLYDGAGYYVWNGNNWDVIISAGNAYKKGKNKYYTLVNGDVREYIVHTPKYYDELHPTPVVFMLHGTTGTGERMYDISGWKELGDADTIITVFPTSWRYQINVSGTIKTQTKWNVTPDAEWTLVPGQVGRDDIAFLNQVVDELKTRFNVDTNRIYLEGFSNGGQMAAKCAVEMGDIFAAVVENSGSFYIDTVYTPVRNLPVLFQIGNEDFGPGVTQPPFPLNLFDSLLNAPTTYYYKVKRAHVRNFSLDSVYTLSGLNFAAKVADFQGLSGDSLNVFKMVFVNGLGHKYPNGENHWMYAAEQHWAWMRQFVKP